MLLEATGCSCRSGGCYGTLHIFLDRGSPLPSRGCGGRSPLQIQLHTCLASPLWVQRLTAKYVPAAPSSHSNTHRPTKACTPSTRAAEQTARPIHMHTPLYQWHGADSLASTRTFRLRLAARTLRLGYNVMFLDTDVIIFDDPYKCVQ